MRYPIFSFFLLTLAFLISGLPLDADVTGSILGTVTDANRGVVPGVEVVAVNPETNLRQTTRSDNVGEYRILALPVGKYRIEASTAGFQKFVVSGIELTVNEQHRVDIVLQVGNVEQSVQVNAELAQVESTNSQLGDVVEVEENVGSSAERAKLYRPAGPSGRRGACEFGDHFAGSPRLWRG